MEILFRKKGLAVSLLIKEKQSVFSVEVSLHHQDAGSEFEPPSVGPRSLTYSHRCERGGVGTFALILHVESN
jgi:hypothetical protein